MKHQSWNKSKRWLLGIGGCIAVLLLVAGGYWYWINIPPQITIPTPVMPQPNGYDYFIRAGAAFVPDKNGVDKTTDVHFVEGKSYPIAAKEAWLKQNAKALQLLREGLKYPALHPPTQPPYDSSPEEVQFKKLAWALVVESHVREARDDLAGAVDSLLDSLKFGYEIQRGASFMTGNIIGNSVQAISLRALYSLGPRLDASLSRRTAARMEQFYEKRFPYFKTMEVEKYKVQADLMVFMGKPEWSQILRGLLNAPAFDAPRRQKVEILYTSKRTLMHDYTELMDGYIAEGQLPYVKMHPVLNSRSLFTEIWAPFEKIPRWNWARVQTYNSLLMIMLALRAFHLEKGHYPTTMKELVPGYLQKIPIDPYDSIEPLHYKLQGNQYLLWSIGPDGVDNHGTPLTNPDPKKRRHSFTSPDSKGDVVAGINMP